MQKGFRRKSIDFLNCVPLDAYVLIGNCYNNVTAKTNTLEMCH